MGQAIVLIDDDDNVREMLEVALRGAGYAVSTAREGDEGLEVCQQANPDLVITDILMPNKEGIETILDLRRERPDVKIIAISGGDRAGGTSFLEMAAKLGADRVLQKPFRPTVLLAAVAELLANDAA